MGTYKNGISGSFSGKIGTVVGSTWNGIDYMRSLPRRSKKKPTEAQMSQRKKLALAIDFLSPISQVVNIGFKGDAVKKSGFNMATSHLLTETISGVYPDFVLDYSKVLLSMGSLTGPWNATVSSVVPGSVTVSWTNNTGSGTAKDTDKAVLVIYNPASSEFVFTLSGADRIAANQVLPLPANFSGDRVEIWIAFIAANNSSISTSIYAGGIVVA